MPAAPSKPWTRGTQRVDTIVVGAGLAGLAAARSLTAASLRVRVLEARDRVGGRTESATIGAGRFDVGGQWAGPTQDRVAKLARDLDVRMFPTHHAGKKVLDLDGTMVTYESDIPAVSWIKLIDLQQAQWRINAKARQVPLHAPYAAPAAAAWDRTTVEAWKQDILLTRDMRKMFDVAVRVVFGAEPSELSLLHFLFYLHAGGGFRRLIDIENGAQQDRFVGGAQELSNRMAATLGDAVTLGAPVRSIEHDGQGVRVRTDGGVYEARRVIVAVPPPLAAAIAFDPPLPAHRQQLLGRMPMGSTAKVITTYADAFWRAEGYSGEVVCTESPISVVFDNTSHDGAQPALVSFIVGAANRRWGKLADDARREAVLGALARWFGRRALTPTHYVEKNWDREVFTGGCPVSIVAPGVLTAFAQSLREPVGPIHWAGTETATVWNGYMEGALESGERAAQEVRHVLEEAR
jgi:monoamine oxidase